MKRGRKYMIYTSEISRLDLDYAKLFYLENYPEDFCESKLYEYASESNAEWLHAEMSNLDIPTDGRIIAIADLGLWNGRKHGYKVLDYNIKSIFDIAANYDDAEFYVENGRLRASLHHHDGTHYIEFRELREDANVTLFLDKIYYCEETRNDIYRYTRALAPRVAKVFGW